MKDIKTKVANFGKKHRVLIVMSTLVVANAATNYAAVHHAAKKVSVSSVLISDSANGIVVTHGNGVSEFFAYNKQP